ncbi:hypothetical protein D3C86_337510 [compost metagenome]
MIRCGQLADAYRIRPWESPLFPRIPGRRRRVCLRFFPPPQLDLHDRRLPDFRPAVRPGPRFRRARRHADADARPGRRAGRGRRRARPERDLRAHRRGAQHHAPAGQLPGAGTLSARLAGRGLCAGAEADRTGFPGARGLPDGDLGAPLSGQPGRFDGRHHPPGRARQQRGALPGEDPGQKRPGDAFARGAPHAARRDGRGQGAAAGYRRAAMEDAASHRRAGVVAHAGRAAKLGGVPRPHA